VEPRSIVRLVLIVVALALFLRASGGRVAPKLAIAPLLFLISRVPVLLGWVAGTLGMYILMSTGAAANGKTPDPWFMAGISAFCGLGFSALVVGPGFMIARAFAKKPEFPLEDREVIEESITANHLFGREARGGKLLITNRRLGFLPHRFNVQLDVWSMPLEQVRGAQPEGNRLVLLDTDQGEVIFVVMSPKLVVERLAAAVRR
jgi:hypothetical protein